MNVTEPLQRALEAFELQCARTVWDALSAEDRKLVLDVRRSPPLKRSEAKYEKRADGMNHYVDTKYFADPRFDRLIRLSVVREGMVPTYWCEANNGKPHRGVDAPGYNLTDFGTIVGRFGEAKTIVDLATAA